MTEPGDPGLPFLMPTTASIRLCQRIEPDGLLFASGLEDRYGRLTEALPLAGGATMTADSAGELRLIRQLRAAAPWLEPAIALIDRQLRIQNWAGRPWLAWRPLCLSGPPGIGKSHIARLIGTLAGTTHAVLDLGGTSDNRTLEGTARGWSMAQPCWPAVMINQGLAANPVLVLEEVDKAGGSASNGMAHHTLLTMLERESAARYWDKCLLAEVDLSHVCWILTCNDAALLPPMLRSRLDIVAVEGPGPEHFDTVVRALNAGIARAWEVPLHLLPEPPPKAMQLLRETFARNRSVRQLRRPARGPSPQPSSRKGEDSPTDIPSARLWRAFSYPEKSPCIPTSSSSTPNIATIWTLMPATRRASGSCPAIRHPPTIPASRRAGRSTRSSPPPGWS